MKIALQRRHRLLLWFISTTLLFLSLAIVVNYFFTYHSLSNYYLQNYDKKTLAELEIYHSGNAGIIKGYFAKTLTEIINLTNDDPYQQALESNDQATVRRILDRQRTVDQTFSSLSALDKAGILKNVSSENNAFDKFIGTSFADRAYFQAVSQTHQPYISDVILNRLNVYTVVFCAPVITGNNQFDFITCGKINLTELTDKLKASGINNAFTDLQTVILYPSGNFLYDNGQILNGIKSIRGQDPVADSLLAGTASTESQEANYQNVTSFAIGNRIDLGNGNTIIAISYLPLTQHSQELTLLQAELNRIAINLVFRDLIFLLLAYLVIYWIIKKHDD